MDTSPTPSSYTHHNAVLAAVNFVIAVFILVFAVGFFPYKPFLPGLAQYELLDYGPPPKAPFDKLIFMVVDALRSDFVYLNGTGFEFTQGLIRNGDALPFTAHARSPTITMPRIKAITTGSIPSFVDVILNFDEQDTSATLASQDSWLAQMKNKATGKLVMYGDDTWLKLFPQTFDRADGTSSFFVSDFTEVDNNVTRHVGDELARNDWSTLVLHYLGLDHIGHKSGPRGPHMIPKQREMDMIVKQIFASQSHSEHLKSTLLVLCGDHGMNDAGNHGASSAGETSSALVFISPLIRSIGHRHEIPVSAAEDFRYHKTVEQSDIAPTLAALLGFPVPRNNLGALISDFLPFWPSARDKSLLLLRNAKQIQGIIAAAFPSRSDFELSGEDCRGGGGDDVRRIACKWQSVKRDRSQLENFDSAWLQSMSEWLGDSQDVMSNMATNYDMNKLVGGQVAVAVACMAVFVISRFLSGSRSVPLVALGSCYGVMMFASSYVEEEHHFWYWMATAWLSFLAIKSAHRSSSLFPAHAALPMLALTATRLLQGWNQTGQKHAGEADIVKSMVLTHPRALWAMVSASYLYTHGQLSRCASDSRITMAAVTSAVAAAFSFKLAFTVEDAPEIVVGQIRILARLASRWSLVHQARAVFYGIASILGTTLYRHARSRTQASKTRGCATLLHLYTLFALTQTRAVNIPLFLLLHAQFAFLWSLDLTVEEITASSLVLQYTAFFAFGGSNSIASVDLSSAYNGVSGFNVVAVGVLMFASNWAGPIYWTFCANLLLVRSYRAGRRDAFVVHASLLTLFAALATGSVMAACTVLRSHLFIWTVFSPKYLYCMVWILGQHLMVNLGIGALLFWLGA